MSRRPPSYTPSPAVPPEVTPRLAAIVEVLAGLKTVSEAARSLKLSRNHFQTILHRGLWALVEAISIKSGGRPGQPKEIARLQAELKRLQRENARLHKQVGSTQRLLTVAGELLHGRIRPTQRQTRTRKSSGARHDSPESDPDGGRKRLLKGADEMRRLGLTAELVAALAGMHAATLRRWRAQRSGERVTPRRGATPPATELAVTRAEDLVRRLHGLIGADALRRSVAGLSRRTAAALKRRTLTAMERERKAALVRITVAQPGVVRGLDAMHFAATDGPLYALIAADGAIPYRSTLTTAKRCDTEFVARTLDGDFEHNGAPLVLRLDRAKAHAAPAVRALLKAHGVLPLHGPPHYPRFYGQLERQNREHRLWMATLPRQPRALLAPCLKQMLHAVNALWPRRTLAWRTAAQTWNARPQLTVDRQAFCEEVHERARKIAHELKRRHQPDDLAERLAIERTLERIGYLQREIGGWC